MIGYVNPPPGGPADGFDAGCARVARGAAEPAILPSARSRSARPQTRAHTPVRAAD